ncbi:ISAs1 family transposase [Synechococcus sp. CS-205]|uniref:ISAs1 family transposase n=1 Tax=Synechococcus sp. CS-205 TaxID=2847984 RepID=UPI00223A850F|nr:ISAs1 family transposase [Synechococcus sp. CS-205]MCT0249539.1 ISAs1 family transposase [Synechococcus sp. CS-205]
MLCTEIARFLFLSEKGAEFLIAIKGSRRKAFQLIRHRLTYGNRVPFQASASERGHGRESTWTLRAMEAPEWIKEIWPGSALIIAMRSVGKREGRPIEQTRYYVTSLRTTATALLQHVRGRWSIENSWHWVTGTQLREDAHRYRERNAGCRCWQGYAPWRSTC